MDKPGHKWMSFMSDDIKLLNITVPGTHNSCAFNCCVFAKCQKISLIDQLNSGVRFIDVRCKHIRDSFRLHHGLFDLNHDYDTGCIDVCIEFLRQNSSETIVVLVSTEHEPVSNKLQFDDVFVNYLEKSKEHWYLEENCPRLGECRGKLVLLRRFSSCKRPLGIDMSGWRFNQINEIKNHPDFDLMIQDVCHATASRKWLEIKTVLDHANSNINNTTRWYLNYCSAEKWPKQPPIYIAWKCNKSLLDYLKDVSVSKDPNGELTQLNDNFQNSFGIIIVDFAEKELIESIYKLNFKESAQ